MGAGAMKKAFTLIEMMVAVLLGSIIVMVTAGVLSSSIKAWEAIQIRVSENYNRRTVLDLLKRQSSSLFIRKFTVSPGGNTPLNTSNGSQLPEGVFYFRGDGQSINFLSTVSFLSDFPGKVAVRYYVVQGQPEDDGSFLDLENSRIDYDPEMDFESQVGDANLEGGLYLYLEEKNLFLSEINNDNGDTDLGGGPTPAVTGLDGNGTEVGDPEMSGEVIDTHTMSLIGPLRYFGFRYRIPGTHGVNEADDESNWSEFWDLDAGDGYPTAIEFTFVFENGASEDTATEDLPTIRMVIPVYDEENLKRGKRDEKRF